MAHLVTVPCWELLVWRGHWQVRSTHATREVAEQQARIAHRGERGIRLRIRESTRRVASYTEAPAPTAAQRFREQQADKMVIRRQALTYYKSGSNGTEVPQMPKDDGVVEAP